MTGLVAVVAVGAAVVAVAIVFVGGSPPVPAQISVQEVINNVETDRPRGLGPVAETYLPAVIGQELLPGDGLNTFADSEARVDISIADYTRVTRTKPNTVWRLGQFSLQEETIIELGAGKIFLFDNASDPTGRPFKVVTPAGTASPRGTWMSVAYDPVEEVAELQCFRGTCVLENELGTQVLKDGEKSVVTPISAPVEPVIMTIEESTEFEDLPEAATGEITIPTPAPTAEPTPTLVTTSFGPMVLHESAEHSFSIQYPAEWTEHPEIQSDWMPVWRTDSKGWFVFVENTVPDGKSLSEYVDWVIAADKGSDRQHEMVSREQTETAQGLPAELLEYTVSWSGEPMTVNALIYLHDYLHDDRLGFRMAYGVYTSRFEEMKNMIDYSFSTFRCDKRVDTPIACNFDKANQSR